MPVISFTSSELRQDYQLQPVPRCGGGAGRAGGRGYRGYRGGASEQGIKLRLNSCADFSLFSAASASRPPPRRAVSVRAHLCLPSPPPLPRFRSARVRVREQIGRTELAGLATCHVSNLLSALSDRETLREERESVVEIRLLRCDRDTFETNAEECWGRNGTFYRSPWRVSALTRSMGHFPRFRRLKSTK